jgi:hypothetical protein
MLPYLSILSLEGNQIEGSIPSTLGLCPKLRSIPPHKKGMEKLRLLDVSNNELTGSILTEIGHLGDQRHLQLTIIALPEHYQESFFD